MSNLAGKLAYFAVFVATKETAKIPEGVAEYADVVQAVRTLESDNAELKARVAELEANTARVLPAENARPIDFGGKDDE